jgi:solute:Na+ symporter, SSS family
MSGMAIGLLIYIVGFVAIGTSMVYFVRGSGRRFIICGKSLPFFLIGTMLLAQALDANATLGNAAGVFTGGFWAGFQFPLGLALCLLVTGFFFAKPLNKMHLLTLPDFYYRRYGHSTEFISSWLMCLSFAILVAGNFAGAAWIISIVFEVPYGWALLIVAAFIFLYTFAGGLYSCVATDIIQIYPALFGFLGAFLYLLFAHGGWEFFSGNIPAGFMDLSGLTSLEHGALLNWAGILALGLGDVVALDFMERIYAAENPGAAQRGCFYGAVLTIVAGLCCSFMGLMGLTLFPEVADPRMVLPMIAMFGVPFLLGLFIMGGIIGAGASTANGGMLGVAAVLGRNILQRNIMRKWRDYKNIPTEVHEESEEVRQRLDKKLLTTARIMTVPVVLFAIYIAYIRPEPGILLVLAFDVVFAGCFVPLTLGIYWKKANAPGALSALVVGSLSRLILFYTIPEHLAGLDTLISPVLSLLVMVPVSLMTQESHPSKHEVLNFVPTEQDVCSGKW